MTPQEFRAALKSASLTQREFSRRAGVSISTVQRWAQGTVPIPKWTSILLQAWEQNNMATYAVTTPPDDPFNSPHRRLVAIAEQISGMLNAGEMDDLPLGTRGALAALPETLMDIAGRITPGRSGIAQSGTLADIVAPLRGANIGHDLSQAWIETRAMRLGLSTAEQVIAVMAFLDRMIQLSFDDGH